MLYIKGRDIVNDLGIVIAKDINEPYLSQLVNSANHYDELKYCVEHILHNIDNYESLYDTNLQLNIDRYKLHSIINRIKANEK